MVSMVQRVNSSTRTLTSGIVTGRTEPSSQPLTTMAYGVVPIIGMPLDLAANLEVPLVRGTPLHNNGAGFLVPQRRSDMSERPSGHSGLLLLISLSLLILLVVWTVVANGS